MKGSWTKIGMTNLVISLLVHFTFTSPAQIRVFERINTDHGLLSEQVINVFQDRTGYIWFCTHNGVMKYDGYELSAIEADNINGIDLKTIAFKGGAVRKDSSIWLASKNQGLYKYNPATKSINRFQLREKPINSLRSIKVDSKDRLWVVSPSTIFKITGVDNIVSKYQMGKDETNSNTDIYYYTDCAELSSGQLIISDWHEKLYFYDENENQFKTYKLLNYIKGLDRIRVWSLYVDSDDNIWCSTWKKGIIVVRYNKEIQDIEIVKRIPILRGNEATSAPINTYSINEDIEGNIWAGTSNGLYIFKNALSNNYTVDTYVNDPLNPKSLSYNYLADIYRDNSGLMWIATNGGGVSKFDPDGTLFTTMPIKTNLEEGTQILKLDCLYKDKEGNLLGSFNKIGLSIYNETSKKFQPVFRNPHFGGFKDYLKEVSQIIQDSAGNYWIGANQKLIHYKTNEKITKYYTKKTHKVSGRFFNDMVIYEDKLIFGTSQGIFMAKNIYGETKINRIQLKKDSKSLTGMSLLIDKKGYLWVGTKNAGIYKSEKPITETGSLSFKPIPIHSDKKNILYIHAITELNDGSLWIAGTGNSLYAYKNDKNAFYKFDHYNRIDCEEIYDILQGNDGSIWLTTNNGLLVSNPRDTAEYYFRKYTVDEGLQGNYFIKNASCKDQEGNLYFGGFHGINKVVPEDISFNNTIPEIVLTEITVMDKPITMNHRDDILKLTHQENHFSVTFSALSYSHQKKNRYAYKLENFDRDWVYSGANRTATYFNLDPGEYTLRVKGSNNYDVWNEKGVSLKVKVLPPWWQTLLFKIIIALLLIGILLAIFRIRTANLRKQKKQLSEEVWKRTKELEELNKNLSKTNTTKDKLFSIIAHDLINPFNVILGLIEMLISNHNEWNDQEKMNHLELMKDSSDNAYTLLNNLLHWSRSQRGTIRFSPKPVNGYEIVENAIIEVISLAKSKSVTIENQIKDKDLMIYVDPDMLSLIFRNLLTNAIKYSKLEGKITIKTRTYKKNRVCYKITDNGIGMDNETVDKIFDFQSIKSTPGTKGEKGTGIGLILCKEFIEKNNGKIWVTSEPEKGSTFSFTTPLNPQT